MNDFFKHIDREIDGLNADSRHYGKVDSVVGTVIEATGLDATVGEEHYIHTALDDTVRAEVVGIRQPHTLLMPLDRVEGLKAGCLIEPAPRALTIQVGSSLLGRVLDANGHPIDDKGPLTDTEPCDVHRDPPDPLDRANIREPLQTGIRSIDAFITMGKGQRMGIFAGSGVGKSVTMGMIARTSSADVNVIALIGERGREVLEFLDDVLGEEGLKRSVVVATTSDKAAMSRVKAAFTATSIAEYFRDQGQNVLLMMDSVTRVAMAQREIGLATGEPPTTKGYTPSVFSLLPRLMERAGQTRTGSITGLYTVLVDNDDMNEPVADAVRSILDGHVVLSRRLAQRNHYPAVDVLASASRVMTNVVTDEQLELARKGREMLSVYEEARDLIEIGAYNKGSDPRIDRAIAVQGALNDVLRQPPDETDPGDHWEQLAEALNIEKSQIQR